MSARSDRDVKRVLHIIAGMDRAGAESLIMNISRKINPDRIRFDYLCSREHCDYDQEIGDLGGRIFCAPNPVNNIVGYLRTLSKVLRENSFCAVHSHLHGFSGACLALAAAHRVPVRIAHSHTVTDGKHSGAARITYRYVMDHLMKRYGTHLFCAAASAGEALYGKSCWKDGRIEIVRNAVDISAFEIDVNRSDARMRLGLPVDAFVIGHVGRFQPVKNHNFLVDVLSGLRARGMDARLVLSGDGPLKESLLACIRDRKLTQFVTLLGVRSDVALVLASLNVFVFPSLHEGLGLAVIEAQAAGCPVIASDSIPPEADLDIGLLRRLPLNDGLHTWCEAIVRIASIAPIPWTVRLKALCQSGYDAAALAGSLEKVYSNGSRYANGAATDFAGQENQ